MSRTHVSTTFSKGICPYWNQLLVKGGSMHVENMQLIVGFDKAFQTAYTLAQLDDFFSLPYDAYPWKPPVRMSIHAMFSFSSGKDAFHGTTGFGFWSEHSLESIGFMYTSKDSHMHRATLGYGWHAQTMYKPQWSNLFNFLPQSTRFSHTQERLLTSNMETWHTYTIEWREEYALFYIDTKKVMTSTLPPAHALGFSIWVDNTYSIVSPHGSIVSGNCDSEGLSLKTDAISIESI